MLFSSAALDTGSGQSGTAARDEADEEVETQAEEASDEADDDMDTEEAEADWEDATEDSEQFGGDFGELMREKNLDMALGLDLLDDEEEAVTAAPDGEYVEEAAWSVVRR